MYTFVFVISIFVIVLYACIVFIVLLYCVYLLLHLLYWALLKISLLTDAVFLLSSLINMVQELLVMGPDKPRWPKRRVTNTGMNIRPIPPIWCPLWVPLSQSFFLSLFTIPLGTCEKSRPVMSLHGPQNLL